MIECLGYHVSRLRPRAARNLGRADNQISAIDGIGGLEQYASRKTIHVLLAVIQHLQQPKSLSTAAIPFSGEVDIHRTGWVGGYQHSCRLHELSYHNRLKHTFYVCKHVKHAREGYSTKLRLRRKCYSRAGVMATSKVQK